MSFIETFLAKEAKSLARSVLQSNAKKGIKNLFQRVKTKSPDQINREVFSDLGYLTTHFTVNKDQDIVYRPSVVFLQEWLTNSPFTAGKLVKDEESGHVYFDGEPIATKKVAIINEFIRQTKTKSTVSLHSNFDGAIKLINVIDYTSLNFKKFFSGWDPTKESVIDTFLTKLYGEALETDAKYATMLFRKWMIGTARRAMEPGVAFDGCLTLTGPGGVGKTSFFRELLPEPFNTRTGEVMCNIKSPQKFVEAVVGKTICCFDELSVLDAPKVQEVFKQLLSARFIDVRLAWRRDAQRFNLRNSFGATTNKKKFIKDQALSRRLWAIELNGKSKINFDFLRSVQKELWKEAVYLANRGEPYLLSPEEQRVVEEKNTQFLV